MVNTFIPLRTCAGTGTKCPQAQLVRFVAVKGVPTPEWLLGTTRAQGRGVYVLPSAEALELAVKKKAFAHKLKTNRPPLSGAAFETLIAQKGKI